MSQVQPGKKAGAVIVSLTLPVVGLLLLGATVNFFERGFDSADWVLLSMLSVYTAWAFYYLKSLRAKKVKRDQDADMRTVLKMAQQSRGVLTVVQVAAELDITTDASQKLLEAIESKGLASMQFSAEQTLEFRFPDFLPKDHMYIKESRDDGGNPFSNR